MMEDVVDHAQFAATETRRTLTDSAAQSKHWVHEYTNAILARIN
jgi:hypothetical protein